MNDLAPIGIGLFFAAIIAVLILGVVFNVKLARRRRDTLQKFADECGFEFDPGDDRNLPTRLEKFATFNRGSSRRAYNTLSGHQQIIGRPIPIHLGDYSYTTESGTGKDRHETAHRLSYLHAELPLVFTGSLAVRRENFLDRIAGAIGFEDINFESAEFSRAFHVKSNDRKLTYDLFYPRMIEWFMSSNPPTLEIIGRDMLLTTAGVWTPEQMRTQLAWAKSFIEHWPTVVIDRLDVGSR